MAVSIAVLDLDGTLLDGFLAAEMAESLSFVPGVASDAVDHALEIIEHYHARRISHDACAEGFYSAYTRAVRGLPTAVAGDAGVQAWDRCRPRLFAHTRPIVTLLRAHDLTTCLLSGSPAEAVSVDAADLCVDRHRGATPRIREGRAERLLRMPAIRGGKRRVLDLLDRELRVGWSSSFAMGDSASDIEVLRQVAMPVAFEPDPNCSRRLNASDGRSPAGSERGGDGPWQQDRRATRSADAHLSRTGRSRATEVWQRRPP